MRDNQQALYLSHGGGPLPLLGEESHEEMRVCLKEIAATIPRPEAIMLVSAHWEASRVTITSGAQPPLIYDYYGFPEESYQIQYPCPGEPRLAERVAGQFAAAGIDATLDATRGFDHGLFVPLKIMYPDADIPCIQVSLLNNLDPGEHLRIGQALQGLHDRSFLLVGSGSSFHNLKEFFKPESGAARMMNEAFEAWLLETCGSPELDESARMARLDDWEAAPYARYCHPRAEHLLPLQVCYGFAASPCSKSFELRIISKKSSMYLW